MSLTQSAALAFGPTTTAEPLPFDIPDGHLDGNNPAGEMSGLDRPGYLQLSHLFHLSPDLLALAAFEPRRWVRVNPAFQTILGWAEHELVGSPVLDIVYPADVERFEAAERNLRELGATNLKIRLLCKDGGCRWVAWRIALDKDEDSLLFTGRDVTESRRTIKNLRNTSVRIKRANESLEQFVRTAGHDLQEPLRTLSMYSDLLLRSYADQMPPKSMELLVQIFGAASRMQLLLHDLLAYARISQESDTRGDRFKDISLERIFNDVVESLKSSIEESCPTITHDPLPDVHGDETQLTQLLQNLLSNSVKYRRPDVPLNVHVGVERNRSDWQFRVTDNGCGFEPKHAEAIFLDFKRLHGREIPGTGLGLAICRRIVQRHGGRIWAEGRPDEGATFWFTLPTHAPTFASTLPALKRTDH